MFHIWKGEASEEGEEGDVEVWRRESIEDISSGGVEYRNDGVTGRAEEDVCPVVNQSAIDSADFVVGMDKTGTRWRID